VEEIRLTSLEVEKGLTLEAAGKKRKLDDALTEKASGFVNHTVARAGKKTPFPKGKL